MGKKSGKTWFCPTCDHTTDCEKGAMWNHVMGVSESRSGRKPTGPCEKYRLLFPERILNGQKPEMPVRWKGPNGTYGEEKWPAPAKRDMYARPVDLQAAKATILARERRVKDVDKVCAWAQEIQAQMNSANLGRDSAEVERLMKEHDAVKASIQLREQQDINLFKCVRLKLKESADRRAPALYAENRLIDTWVSLNVAWGMRRVMLLQQGHEQPVFNELVDPVESWPTTEKVLLSSEEPGSSVSEEESLLRKAQLEQTAQFQQFSDTLDNCNAWIKDQLAMASDNSWKDPVHVERNLQHLASVVTELSANQGRKEALVKDGKRMIEDGNLHSDTISQKIGTLDEEWKLLLEASADKKRLLGQVQYAVNLAGRCKEFDSWLINMEAILQSHDTGDSISACLTLMDKANAAQLQIAAEALVLKDLHDKMNQLPLNDHLLTTEIADRLESANRRFSKLDDMVKTRLTVLEEAQKFHHFNLEYHDIVRWFTDKQTELSLLAPGSCLSESHDRVGRVVQIENEINQYYANNLLQTLEIGCKLVASNFCHTESVTAKLDKLRDGYKNIQKQCQGKKRVCVQSVDSQKFHAEVRQLDAVYAQKKLFLEVKDVGHDEDSIMLLIQQLDPTEQDVHAFGKNVERLGEQVKMMRAAGHFDVMNADRQFDTIAHHHRELKNLLNGRRAELLDWRKLFAFSNDCGKLLATISQRMLNAESTDYWTDIDHMDKMLQDFANFHTDMKSLQMRVHNMKDKGQKLINERHPQMQAIKTKIGELNEAWRRLQESLQSRQAVLAGVKAVHSFIRDCAEQLGSIRERGDAMSTEDGGKDLDRLAMLLNCHEGFQSSLELGVMQRVSQLNDVAANLIANYPDAGAHINQTIHELNTALTDLISNARMRRDKLKLAKRGHIHLAKHRDFSSWIGIMKALITSYKKPPDVNGAVNLLRCLKKHKAEIDLRLAAYEQMTQEGLEIISKGHLMADEILTDLKRLEKGYCSLQVELQGMIRLCGRNANVKGQNPMPEFTNILQNVYSPDMVKSYKLAENRGRCSCALPLAGQLPCEDRCYNRSRLYECTPENCRFKDVHCSNRPIQDQQFTSHIEVSDTEHTGKGVFATDDITMGSLVCEYLGEVCTQKEYTDKMKGLYKECRHHYCLHVDKTLVIDAHQQGGIARNINHSCNPNCGVEKWFVDGYPRMVIRALKNIQSGEEITYKYNFENYGEPDVCLCLAANCVEILGTVETKRPAAKRPISSSVNESVQCVERKKTTRFPVIGQQTPRVGLRKPRRVLARKVAGVVHTNKDQGTVGPVRKHGGQLDQSSSVLSDRASPVRSSRDKSVIARDDNLFLHCEIGQIIDSEYKVMAKLGTGTFGQVWQVERVRPPKVEPMALKIIRLCNDGDWAREARMLQHVRDWTGPGCSMIVRFFEHFIYHDHHCMLFEHLGWSVRQVLNDNNWHPFRLNQIREMAFQLCLAVQCLADHNAIHTDLKPDNIVFVDPRNICYPWPSFIPGRKDNFNVMFSCRIKVIDVAGLSLYNGNNRGTYGTPPYRPPEVVLKRKWSFPLDMWSVGCIMMELYSGRILFPAHTESEHLAMMEKRLGKLPPSLTKGSDFYDQQGNFKWHSLLPTTKGYDYVMYACSHIDNVRRMEDAKKSSVKQLFDFIKRMLHYDPKLRITASDALRDLYFLEIGDEMKRAYED